MPMALIVFVGLSVSELLLWWRPLWWLRKPLAGSVVVLLAVTSGVLVVDYFSVWAVLTTVFSLYRVINLLRLIEGRLQADNLYHVSRQTALWLIGLQGMTIGLAYVADRAHITLIIWLYGLAAVQLLAGLVILSSTLRHLRTTRPKPLAGGIAERDLPSLTVAIPARNETAELETCLRSLLASAYPKLEILVLDDCSQDKRTSEVIRDFAHDGVRFIPGEVPPDQWLAKNYAYQRLAEAANGELLLFCGVDTRFTPDSLTELVKLLLRKNKLMVSLLPHNAWPARWSTLSMLVQPARYAWELALPRRLLDRPPVLSTCWLIRRQALEAAGGFAAVSRKIVPESYLARSTAANGDGYSFMQARDVMSEKDLAEQRATAIRTRYPQLHRRPELVAIVALAEVGVLLWPLITCVVALLTNHWLLAALTGLAYAMQLLVYSLLVNLTYRRFVLRGTWLLPFAALYDLGLLHYSMWQYEFNEVVWKGRNVCIPVMQAIPRLPKI